VGFPETKVMAIGAGFQQVALAGAFLVGGCLLRAEAATILSFLSDFWVPL